MARRYLWTDKEIKIWAKKYLKKRETLMTLEQSTEVSHSTLWWCFVHRLEGIDPDLYDSVNDKLELNRRYRRKRA